MHPLEQSVLRLLTEVHPVAHGARLMVGVSGGADSIALLHILAALRSPLACTLVAVYIDHCLRPDETPAEWDCVRHAATRLGIDTETVAIDVAGWATAHRLSVEAAARDLRYRAFAELRQRLHTDFLTVAHTADDQAEEVLLRLVRGGGRKALSGMRVRSGTVLRPLLTTTKADLLAYLTEHAIGFCHDSSNDDPRFLRNRIRTRLLPLLEADYDPGIRRALRKTASNLAEDEDLLQQLLDQAWDEAVTLRPDEDAGHIVCSLDRRPFCLLHPALQRRLVERMLWSLGGQPRYEQIMAVATAARSGRTGSELHLSRGLRVRVDRDHLLLSYPLGRGPWRGRLPPS